MNRLVIATGTVVMLLLAACGSSVAGATGSASSSGSSSGGGGGAGAGRNGAAGELTQINGTSLILNTTAGDVTVQFTSTTPVTKTSTGTVADIVTGTCVVITGTRDATGAITANSVRLSDAVNGACPTGRGPGGGGPGAGAGGGGGGSGTSTGSGGGSGGARPTPPANFASARGLVTAVAGTSVTVQDTSGAPVTLTVPTTVQVSKSATASPSDLTIGDCVAAVGTKDTSGTVTARSLSVVPAGPSGCFTGGGGRGFGGFGGGRGGGGFGGGGGSASATGTGG